MHKGQTVLHSGSEIRILPKQSKHGKKATCSPRLPSAQGIFFSLLWEKFSWIPHSYFFFHRRPTACLLLCHWELQTFNRCLSSTSLQLYGREHSSPITTTRHRKHLQNKLGRTLQSCLKGSLQWIRAIEKEGTPHEPSSLFFMGMILNTLIHTLERNLII